MESKHRKELVAGNLAEFAISGEPLIVFNISAMLKAVIEYADASDRLGDDCVSLFQVEAQRLAHSYTTSWLTQLSRGAFDNLPEV